MRELFRFKKLIQSERSHLATPKGDILRGKILSNGKTISKIPKVQTKELKGGSDVIKAISFK